MRIFHRSMVEDTNKDGRAVIYAIYFTILGLGLDSPPPLVVQSSAVLAALHSFPKGTSPGNFGLQPSIFSMQFVVAQLLPPPSVCRF